MLLAYMKCDSAGHRPFSRWFIAAHLRECDGCAQRHIRVAENRTEPTPWTVWTNRPVHTETITTGTQSGGTSCFTRETSGLATS